MQPKRQGEVKEKTVMSNEREINRSEVEEYGELSPVERETKQGSFVSRCVENDRGVAVVEVILILVVLIALVIIFRDQIVSLVHTIWRSINGDAKELL